MALIQNTGQSPDGSTHAIPIAGVAALTTTPLAANAKWDSGIQPYNGNESVHFSIQADQVGSYVIEYYKDGVKIGFTGQPTPYDPAIVTAFQGALSGKGNALKLIFTNGSVAQTQFYAEIRLADITQETLRSIGTPMSSTNLGSSTHAVIEGRENGIGVYKQNTVTANGSKVGVDVNVLNSIDGGSTGVTVNIATTANSKVILASNPNRKGCTVFSVSGTILVTLGASSSATVFTARLITNGYYEIPFGYIGPVSAIGSGNVTVTELT